MNSSRNPITRLRRSWISGLASSSATLCIFRVLLRCWDLPPSWNLQKPRVFCKRKELTLRHAEDFFSEPRTSLEQNSSWEGVHRGSAFKVAWWATLVAPIFWTCAYFGSLDLVTPVSLNVFLKTTWDTSVSLAAAFAASESFNYITRRSDRDFLFRAIQFAIAFLTGLAGFYSFPTEAVKPWVPAFALLVLMSWGISAQVVYHRAHRSSLRRLRRKQPKLLRLLRERSLSALRALRERRFTIRS